LLHVLILFERRTAPSVDLLGAFIEEFISAESRFFAPLVRFFLLVVEVIVPLLRLPQEHKLLREAIREANCCQGLIILHSRVRSNYTHKCKTAIAMPAEGKNVMTSLRRDAKTSRFCIIL